MAGLNAVPSAAWAIVLAANGASPPPHLPSAPCMSADSAAWPAHPWPRGAEPAPWTPGCYS
eukprot:scaffold17069_cov21-Phaeocystis_antarctica.AAC.1